MNEGILTTEEKNLLKKYVHFMAGFEESSLYEDYKAVDDTTDEEFSNAFELIRQLSLGK